MKSLLGLFVMSCFFTCFGCSRAQGKLDGEVFIVTQGAESVKLGLVEVRILPYEATKTSISKTRADAEKQVANLQPKLDAARAALTSAEGRSDAARAESDTAFKRTQKQSTDDYEGVMASYDASSRAADRWLADLRATDSARRSVTELEKQVRSWNSGAFYFASLPSPLTSVKTDSDGKFSILLDRTATVVLAANATRHVADKIENYYWLITVSLDGQPQQKHPS
jgi:hypothetical protein